MGWIEPGKWIGTSAQEASAALSASAAGVLIEAPSKCVREVALEPGEVEPGRRHDAPAFGAAGPPVVQFSGQGAPLRRRTRP
jgi:hypothetical protein